MTTKGRDCLSSLVDSWTTDFRKLCLRRVSGHSKGRRSLFPLGASGTSHSQRRVLMFKRLRSQAGAALVEYSLLVAGIALIGAAAVAVFGHKTTDMMAAMAAVMPGAHADDNAPIVSGKIIETIDDGGPGGNAITLDINAIGTTNVGTERLGNNLGTSTQISTLVVEAQ